MSAFWPFIVIGVFTGGLYGLAALGMVLTYKTVGVFNFAYGAIAMFCAFTYWQLHDDWGLTAWIAMPILFLVVAPLMGVILEALFRPLSGASAEVVIVVSLGVLAALTAAAGLLWAQDHQLQPIFPISTFVLGSHLHVGYDQLGTLLVSLSVAGLLWALLRRTRFGTSTRAVVDNPDLSDMMGIHGDNVRRVAWILSCVFAALVGILISPSQGLDVNELVLVVIYAFAPAVLGILFGLPAAYVGGLGLGIAVSVMSKWSNSGTVADIEAALPYLALFALLVVFGTRLKSAGSGAVAQRLGALRSSVSGAGSRAASVALGRRVRLDRNLAVGLGLLVVALFVPAFVPGPHLVTFTQGFMYALIALTLVVLTGWAGQISLAQFAFVGVGAFTAGHLAGAHGQHFLFAVVMGMLFAIPLGIVVGLVSLRLSGLYLALATLAFALMMDDIVFNRNDVSGGLTGITVPRPGNPRRVLPGQRLAVRARGRHLRRGGGGGVRAAQGPDRAAAAHSARLAPGRIDARGQPDGDQDCGVRGLRHGGVGGRGLLRRPAAGHHPAGLHVVDLARAAAAGDPGRALGHCGGRHRRRRLGHPPDPGHSDRGDQVAAADHRPGRDRAGPGTRGDHRPGAAPDPPRAGRAAALGRARRARGWWGALRRRARVRACVCARLRLRRLRPPTGDQPCSMTPR